MARKPGPKGNTLSRRHAYATSSKALYHTTKALARWGIRRLAKNTINKTLTSYKRPKLNQRVIPVGSGSSQSFFRKVYRCRLPAKVMKALTPIRIDVETTGFKLQTLAYGIQTAYHIAQFTSSKLLNMFTNLVDSSSSATQSIFLRNIEEEYLISNASSANVFIRLYEITARNDSHITGTSPVLGQQLFSAVGTFDQGIYDINSACNATTLGLTPFQSTLFTQNFRVDKVYHIELGAGRSHKHVSRFSPNHMVNKERASRTDVMKDLTRYVMIQAYGSPVNDATTTTNVSSSLVNLDIVVKRVTKCQSLDPQGSVIYNSQGLGAVATAKHVDEEGNVQTEVEA